MFNKSYSLSLLFGGLKSRQIKTELLTYGHFDIIYMAVAQYLMKKCYLSPQMNYKI